MTKEEMLKRVNHYDYTKRKITSFEVLASLCALVFSSVFVDSAPAWTIAVGVSFLSCAYFLARTILKVHRELLRYSSFRSSEAWAHFAAQAAILFLRLFFDLNVVVGLSLVIFNASFCVVCRGIVKSHGIFKLKQQVVALR